MFKKKNLYKTVGGAAHTGQAVRCTTIAVLLTMNTSKKDITLCLRRGLFTKRFTQVSSRILTLRYEEDFFCKISLQSIVPKITT